MMTNEPCAAMSGDKLVIEGAAIGWLKLTETLSKVAVAVDEVLPLSTTKPTYTFGVMLRVALPTTVQLTPSEDL